MNASKLHFLWRDCAPLKQFRTGVSLHSHTLHSMETFGFLPRYAAGVPLLDFAVRQQSRIYEAKRGAELDFSRAFWRPPLAPREAYDLERRQIEDKLDLDAMVSLSDHDDIQAGSLLAAVEPHTPISVEWTVPYGPAFFHLGVHNLPAKMAGSVMLELAAFTRNPRPALVGELLEMAGGLPESLLVFNHPMWDEARIGAEKHAQLATEFLEKHGAHLHALELNGLRPWKENRQVMAMAQRSGHVLISGGDRHGLEPNANVNLTNAGTFAEFVAEIREDQFSDILFLPQYREPIRMRMIETMWDIVREYPEFPVGRRTWNERIFYCAPGGVTRSLAEIWRVEPWPVRWFLAGLRALKNHPVRSALRMALAEAPEAGL